MKNYVAVVHLVKRPPCTETEWFWVAHIAYQNGQSIVGSADDAKDIVEDALPGSKVIAWRADDWGSKAALLNYLGVRTEFREFDPPFIMGCPNCATSIKFSFDHRTW